MHSTIFHHDSQGWVINAYMGHQHLDPQGVKHLKTHLVLESTVASYKLPHNLK